MRRLDRYVLLSFAQAWGVAFVFFCGMYLVIHFFNKLGDLSEASEAFRAHGWSPFKGFCLYYGLNLPFVMVQTAPFTILMGSMWALQQMVRRNELVPVLVAGVSYRRLALPLLLSAFLIALGFAGVREKVLPAIAAERHQVERIFKGKSLEEGTLKPAQIRDADGRIWRIRSYRIDTREAEGVDVVLSEGGARARISFDRIRWEPGVGWVTGQGNTARPDALARTDLQPRDIELDSRSLLFLDVTDLERMIARYPHRTDLRLRLHAHFAYPLGTIVLLLMGLPLVLRSGRTSPFVSVGASLILSIAFFTAQSVMQDLGSRDEILNPVLGAWLPIILFGAVGVLLFETMPT